MKFKYRKINLSHPFSQKKYILRPIIPISLKSQESSIRDEALIDSGSDFNIFPVEIAEKLGINLKQCKRIYFSGVEDSTIEGYIASVLLSINHESFNTHVVFADLANTSAILGQNGFFDVFVVKFNLRKEELEVKFK